MPSKPVITSTLMWNSRIEAEETCQEILRGGRYSIGDTITDIDDVAVLTAILEVHPHTADKVGSGVKHFSLEQNAGTAGIAVSEDSIGFWITRTDGTKIDFSYIESIYPSDKKKQVTTALRADVDDLRLEYRDSRWVNPPVFSDVSGDQFARRQDSTVIYEIPSFAQMAYVFARQEGGWDAIDVVKGSRNAFIGDQLADPNVLGRWRQFYATHARPKLATRSEGARRPKTDETAWAPGR